MTTKASPSAAESESTPPIPRPSSLWCFWQCFIKGTSPTYLTIPDADLRGKWIIITGGNSGIGKEAAVQFAKWGANIVLGCRQPPPHEPHPDVVIEECKAAALGAGIDGTVFEWWECDMGNLESVEAFAKRWLAKECALDILANNAGVAKGKGKEEKTIDGFEVVHQVNFLSHVYLTMSLLPCLKLARRPRIICTTSCMQYIGEFDLTNTTSSKNAYPNNKLYFQTWLTELQHRMSKTSGYRHVSIRGVHPGFVKTNIWVQPQGNDPIPRVGRVVGAVLDWFAIDAQQGSLAITTAASAPESGSDLDEPQADGGGQYFNRVWEAEPMPQTRHPECRRQIWEYVNRELGLEEKGLVKDFDIQDD